MNRAPSTPGRVAFVGSGPGDPGLLTVRARDALASAPLVVTDPDVPDGVLALVADGAEVRPALGEPAEVAKTWSPRRPRAGRSSGWSPATRCRPTPSSPRRSPSPPQPAVRRRARRRPGHRRADLRGCPARLGAHRGRRARGRGLGGAGRAPRPAGPARHRRRTWPTSRGPDRARPAPTHAGRRHRPRHAHRAEDRADHARGAGRRGRGPRRPAGRHDRQGRRAAREAVLVGEPRAVRLDRAGAAHQGPGRRDEREAASPRRHRRSRCRPSPSSRRAAPRRWSARSRVWSTAATSGWCSPPPTRCARCGRSSTSSAWTPARSPA